MRKDLLIPLAVLIPAAIIMLIVANNFSNKRVNNPFATNTPYPTISAPTNENENTSVSPASSQNIEVLSPLMGDEVKSGFVVKGNARTFESSVSIRLLDSEGNVLAESFTLANAPDVGQFGPFEKQLNFQTESETGTLEVFQASAKDGSEIDKVIIPLLFR